MEDGRVNRADVRREGRRMVIHAKKGIILNTGGFSHNRRMREENQPKPASVDWTLANPGDTGEMIEMAKALGAATDLMDASRSEERRVGKECVSAGKSRRGPDH